MKVKITQEHIEQGMAGYSGSCPLVYAICAALGLEPYQGKVSVAEEHYYVDHYRYDLPPEAVAFRNQVDLNKDYCKPAEIDFPELRRR